MTEGSLWYVQSAIHTRLTTAAVSLTALLPNGAESIFDHVPTGASFPYVVMGDVSYCPIGTQGQESSEIVMDIHTYSRFLGMEETKKIMVEITASLHRQDFEITKTALIMCRCIAASTTLMGDGKTRHGLQKFQIITDDTWGRRDMAVRAYKGQDLLLNIGNGGGSEIFSLSPAPRWFPCALTMSWPMPRIWTVKVFK